MTTPEVNTFTSILDNSCTVKMMYLGPQIIKSNSPYKFKIHADEILIIQAHTTTGTKSIFKGCLKPNDEFIFKSHRLIDHHFDITIYVNGMIDQHVFVCCEKGFFKQSHFVTSRGSCQLQSITGGIPCQMCQSQDMIQLCSNDTQHDNLDPSRPNSVQSISRPSLVIQEQTQTKFLSDTLTKSKEVIMAIESDQKQISSLNTTSQITESNQVQTLIGYEKSHDISKEVNQQKDNQSIGNIEAPKDTATKSKQTDSTMGTKIMNEDEKTPVSSAASLQMQQLLTGYLKLLLPQTKPNEMADKNSVKSHIASKSLVDTDLNESNREMKSKMQYTDSKSQSSIIVSKAESFVLIWLDQTIQKNQDTVESEEKLRAIVNSLITCHTINETIDLIKQIQDQQIYLIVSGEHAKKLLSINDIIDLSKINSIYIFCRDQSKYNELIQSENKVRAIFVEIDSLCIRLKEDTKQALKNLLPISTTSGSLSNEQNQVKFLCSQLHRDLLFTMEYNNNAKEELADFCFTTYKSNPTQLKYIDQLRKEYHAGKAILWYTQQTFLYQMLNNALLTQDISILYKCHFFIKDLHMQLEQMHSLYKPSLESRIFTVYRGLSMPLEVFEKTFRAELNNLIAFDSFLSTSLEKNVAKHFALDKRNPKYESVVISIEIDADQMDRPFADISRWSIFQDEREVLFSIGTVFRIDYVAEKKNEDGIWIVQLSTVGEKDKQLQIETQQIQSTLLRFFFDVLHAQLKVNDYRQIAASNANVASMYYKQEEYKESLQFYQEALTALDKSQSTDLLTRAMYISNIAKTYLALEDHDQALGFYKQALEIRRPLCQANDPSLIHTLHIIGRIYCVKKQWNEALEQYNEALKLQLSSKQSRLLSDPFLIATTYICIGNIFNEKKEYQQGLDSFSKALEQQHEHLSKQHPVLAFLYNNIGAMYYKLEKFNQALENHLKCLEIELKTLPKEHKTFAATYKNISTTYEKLQQYDKAIEFVQKCIDQLKLSYGKENAQEFQNAMFLLQKIQAKRDNKK